MGFILAFKGLKKLHLRNGYSEFVLVKTREVKVKQSHFSPGQGQRIPGG
jgi:hypothetical protein